MRSTSLRKDVVENSGGLLQSSGVVLAVPRLERPRRRTEIFVKYSLSKRCLQGGHSQGMRYVGMWRIMSARYLTYLSMLEVCWLLRLFGACLEGLRGRVAGGGMCGGEGESEGSDVKGRILNLNLDVYLHKILQVFTDILLLWIW